MRWGNEKSGKKRYALTQRVKVQLKCILSNENSVL